MSAPDRNLRNWLESTRGQTILCQERAVIGEVLPRLFGRTLLQIGNWGGGLLQLSAHWRTGVVGGFGDGQAQVVCDLTALPLVKHSVDAIVLPHALEMTSWPHQLLREMDRALTPRGQVIILGFNPWNWWGLRQRLLPGLPAYPSGLQSISAGRVCDWLSVLDFEVLRVERFGPRIQAWPPALRAVLRPFSACYLILARKRAIPVNPLRQRWRDAGARLDIARLPSARIARRNGS